PGGRSPGRPVRPRGDALLPARRPPAVPGDRRLPKTAPQAKHRPDPAPPTPPGCPPRPVAGDRAAARPKPGRPVPDPRSGGRCPGAVGRPRPSLPGSAVPTVAADRGRSDRAADRPRPGSRPHPTAGHPAADPPRPHRGPDPALLRTAPTGRVGDRRPAPRAHRAPGPLPPP